MKQKKGDSIYHEPYSFKILDMEDHHIKYVEVTKDSSDVEQSNHEMPLSQTEVLS